MSAHRCPDCEAETQYQVLSGGREWFCPECGAGGEYPPDTAPRRVQMIADGRFAELRAEMRAHLAELKQEGQWPIGGRPDIEHARSEHEADSDEHGPMPIDTDGDGPADQAHTVAVVCWCGVNGCERFRS